MWSLAWCARIQEIDFGTFGQIKIGNQADFKQFSYHGDFSNIDKDWRARNLV